MVDKRIHPPNCSDFGGLNSGPGLPVEFACAPCACVGFLRLLPHIPKARIKDQFFSPCKCLLPKVSWDMLQLTCKVQLQ